MYIKGYSRIDLIRWCLYAIYIDLKDLLIKGGNYYGTVVL